MWLLRRPGFQVSRWWFEGNRACGRRDGKASKPSENLNPTLTYQNLLFCRVPIKSLLGSILRTYKKVGFGRLRYINPEPAHDLLDHECSCKPLKRSAMEPARTPYVDVRQTDLKVKSYTATHSLHPQSKKAMDKPLTLNRLNPKATAPGPSHPLCHPRA